MLRLVVLMSSLALIASATPAAAQDRPDKALGRSTTASSVQGGQTACAPPGPCLTASMANDGRTDTRWSSEYLDDQWWQVDLGGPRLVDTVALTWELAHPRRFRISTSLDGVTYTTASEPEVQLTPQELAELASAPRTNRRLRPRATSFAPRLARYVRITGLQRTSVYGLSLWDAAVFGPDDPPPPGSVPFESGAPDPAPPPIAEPVVGERMPAAAGPRQTALRALRPEPVVRIKGTLTRRGARIELFTVTAPRNARVRVRCRGDGCPPRLRSPRRTLRRYLALERTLASGVVIEALISRRGSYGKYTRIKIRRGRPPARVDRCLVHGASRPVRCPS